MAVNARALRIRTLYRDEAAQVELTSKRDVVQVPSSSTVENSTRAWTLLEFVTMRSSPDEAAAPGAVAMPGCRTRTVRQGPGAHYSGIRFP